MKFIWDAICEIPKVLGALLGSIIDYLNPFSENFFLKTLFKWIGSFFESLWEFFIRLFVPNENYFNNKIDFIKSNISQKIPYQDYVDMFETVKQVESGQDISISLNNYKVGTSNFNIPNFINFSWVTKYKSTWYSWVRGLIFILLIIYNVNQVIKLFRGYNVAEGLSKTGGDSK
ncbi:MAG: hypothetical protein HFJ37_03895 [Clostridia bacterium]|nr:hypothetical protein [Clostridia bacterium]